MTAAVIAPPGPSTERPGTGLEAVLVSAAGIALLVARQAISPMFGATGLLGVYALLALLGLRAGSGVSASAPALPVSWALAVGLAGIGLVTAWWRGPALPAPSGSSVALSVVAAVAEEAFFRRFLFGALQRFGPVVAVTGSALLFALVHVPAYGPSVLWIDLAAGLLLSWQRWASGSWAAPAATHAVANLMAVLR